jgi:hypothetical protein
MKITVFILIILIYFPWWEENNQLLINEEGPWPAYTKSHMHPSFGTLIGTSQKIPQITFFCSSDVRRNAWAKMARGKPKSCHFIFVAHVRLSKIKFICSNMWYQSLPLWQFAQYQILVELNRLFMFKVSLCLLFTYSC